MEEAKSHSRKYWRQVIGENANISTPLSDWYDPPLHWENCFVFDSADVANENSKSIRDRKFFKKETWFINPRRDSTTLTKPGTSKNESIYFLHPYLDFLTLTVWICTNCKVSWYSDSLIGFPHETRQDSSLFYWIFTEDPCFRQNLWHVVRVADWSFYYSCLFWSSYYISKHFKRWSHLSGYLWDDCNYRRRPLIGRLRKMILYPKCKGTKRTEIKGITCKMKMWWIKKDHH